MSRNYLISIAIFLLVCGWMASGLLRDEPKAEVVKSAAVSAAEKAADDMPRVRGMRSIAQEHQVELHVRGRTQENRSVKVRSELSGKVAEVAAPRGTRVAKGDVLCRLEINAREVNLTEAKAVQHQAELEYRGALDLAQKGLQSEINIAQAKARMETGNAAVRRATLDLENTSIRAPFAGVVNAQAVEVGDFLAVGGECVTLLEMDPLLMVGQVAERDIAAVEVGAPVVATLLTGETVRGKVSFISQSSDKVTRSYRIEAQVPNPDGALKAGITSDLVVPLHGALAHRISPAVVVLDDTGALGVRGVNEDGRVSFHHIEIISEGTDGVWITGTDEKALPDVLDIITVGQETVFAGQRVRIDLTPLTSLAERQQGGPGA